jgi:hypothetical protein
VLPNGGAYAGVFMAILRVMRLEDGGRILPQRSRLKVLRQLI